MDTAILCSRKCDRLCCETLTLTPQLKSRRNASTHSPNAKQNSAFDDSRRRRRSVERFKSFGLPSQFHSQSMVSRNPATNLVMGQVKILKRGDTLITAFKKNDRKQRLKIVDDIAVGSTDRLGPDPEIARKQMRVNKEGGVYAGVGFFLSPPPSSLPVPAFLVKIYQDNRNGSHFRPSFRV